MKNNNWLNKSNFLLALFFLLAAFLYWVRGILVSFLIAIIIAYLLYPLVSYLEKKRKVTRLGAIFLAYLLIAIFLILLFLYIIPLLNQELDQLISDIPYYAEEIQKLINHLEGRYQRALNLHVTQRITQEFIARLQYIIIQLVRRTTFAIVWLITSAINLVIGLILAFYLLRDFDQLKNKVINLLPPARQRPALILWQDINLVIEGFIRGQLLVAVFMALFITLGLYLLGIEYALIIGVIAGIVGIIPYLGSIVGALPAVVLGLLQSPWLAVKVIILFFITNQIEGSIISPKIVGSRVGLHPLVVILSLLAGGQLLGIGGMLIAVPTAAIIKVLLKHLWFWLPDK